MQAVEAKDMGSDSDSEVSDGDEATNEQLQQQYVHGGGMFEGGGAAAAPSRTGPFLFKHALLSLLHHTPGPEFLHQALKLMKTDSSP